jgi:hypothetical protein
MLVPTEWRVGDVPIITSSRGTMSILMPGSVIRTAPTPTRRRKPKETHADDASTFGVVYVNDVARATMASAQPGKFPTGSIIVREKLARADDAQPQLVAVMLKRAPGFNPKAGDWEFLMVNGALTKIQERQKQGSCLACHATQRARDFIFQTPAVK